MNRNTHRVLLSGAFAVAVGAGVIAASAATLGGINTKQLGAEHVTVGGCDTDGVAVAYNNEYNASIQAYVVKSVVISDIASGCVGESLSVELHGTGGTKLSEVTGVTVAGTSETVTLVTKPATEGVLGSAVVITGV